MKKILPVVCLLFIFLLYPRQANAASTLLSETFTANNGTELSHYNNLWQARFPEIQNSYVYSNQLEDVSNNSGYFYKGFSNLEDVCVSTDFRSDWNINSWISLDTRRGNGDMLYSGSFDNRFNYSLAKDYSALKSGAIPYGPLDNSWHNIKFCSVSDKHELYLDGNLIDFFQDNTYKMGYVGFDTGPGMTIDNFVIIKVSRDISLDVPLIKQTNSLWKNNIYDSAKLWSPKDTSIGSWGCALTSAVMVFNYSGINELPNGFGLNPGSLNDWLKLQKDGYVENGLINWLALSRLSKQAVLINNISDFDALEFSKTVPGTVESVKNDLENSIPDILEQPGHFIVARGTENGVVQINDPYYSRSSLFDYGNTVKSVNKFSPSHTDLSYVLITYPVGVNLTIMDSDKYVVGQSFQGDPINNANKSGQASGNPIMLYYVQKPKPGKYLLNISALISGIKKLKIYQYDKSGNVYEQDVYVKLNNNQGKTINVDFDQTENIYSAAVTYNSLRTDLNKALRKKEIQPDFYANLIARSAVAQAEHKLGRKYEELAILMQMHGSLDSQVGSKVFDPSYASLLYDLNYLENNL